MIEQFFTGLEAKLYTDCRYIIQKLKLKNKNLNLITHHRKNMQTVSLSKVDKYYLKQPNKIGTLFSLFKGKYNLVSSRAHRV